MDSRRSLPQLAVQESFGHLQLTVHRRSRYVQGSGRLIVSEASKAQQLDDFALAAVVFSQTLQGQVQLDNAPFALGTITASSNCNFSSPPPRFCERLALAWSTRMRRRILAEIAKKWTQSCQSTFASTSRR